MKIMDILLIFLGIMIIIQMITFIVFYIDSGKVECNPFYCTFTIEKTTIESRLDCYHNGEKINCSNIHNIIYIINITENYNYENG